MAISIRAFKTGQIQMRPSMLTQPADRPVMLRRLYALLDRSWLYSVPVYAFLIDHPEGQILFDTGLSPNAVKPGYFSWLSAIPYMSKLEITEDEGIGAQLRKAGADPANLQALVISHLHYDHGGGLPDVVGSPVYITKEHWEEFAQYTTWATLGGAAPNQWPKDFLPEFLQPSEPPIEPFERSYPITSDGKVVAVDTPGHTPGHVSLIVYGDDMTYLLLGDASYSLGLLDKELTDGVNDGPQEAVESMRKIKEFCRRQKTVVLSAHDLDTALMLEERRVYQPSDSP